ncbi:pyridoxal-dependent decarboxylase [Thermodesulfobacteriota bacterium]
MPEHTDEKRGADPFKPYRDRFECYSRMPEKGRDEEDIYRELSTMAEEENAKWMTGQVSGTFYHAGEEHRAFLNRVFSLFSHVNTIQADLCPSMSKFESEIVSMTAGMLNSEAAKSRNPEDEVCGTVTSGGSESILMAMKVYREKARVERGITAPEIIMPKTAHPAFNKAGEYFGIKMAAVPVDLPDFRVDPHAVEDLINENTVALVGSAGNYPYGLIDPLEELSDIALRHAVGFHVDGCLGGFILPWVEKLGYRVPVFDFRLPGLTSMSADTHKFGFGLKGTSVVLYRNTTCRRYQYFSVPDWSGGLYGSPSMPGSRSGGLSASTWASMVYLGEEGYMKAARSLMSVADAIKSGIEEMRELTLIGEPTFVISFRSDEVDVFHVNDFMKTRGWRFNVLQLPPALHFCVTMPQTMVPGLAERLIRDLKSAVDYAKSAAGTDSQTSALYGVSGSVEGNRMVSELLASFFDHFYTV